MCVAVGRLVVYFLETHSCLTDERTSGRAACYIRTAGRVSELQRGREQIERRRRRIAVSPFVSAAMTDNNDNGAAAKKPPAAANASDAASDCNGCDHKKTPEKRKTPLLPEPPKQTASSATSTASIPVFPAEKQATKRPHSATTTATTTTSAVTVTAVDPASTITLTVAPFTGGPFSLKMRKSDSVEDLKKAVAKKLKVLKDRICLLYRER